jgi:hypothetical protein
LPDETKYIENEEDIIDKKELRIQGAFISTGKKPG